MTGLNHVLTGATVAAAINRPLLALPAALVSHFAIDSLPHFHSTALIPQPRAYRLVVGLDLVFSLVLIILLCLILNRPAWLVASGAVLGILPDATWPRSWLQGQDPKFEGRSLLNRFRRFHIKIQAIEEPWGAYFEIVWFVAILYLVLRFAR